jgi:dipeptidyl aminopeptidase/acylaminoacyl peptidase
VDLPPQAAIKRMSDRKSVMELESGDISELLKTGWSRPEVFAPKARDGQTDIWGIIIKPTNFDPSKRYAVIENIYAGPQSSFVPKAFSAQAGMQALAELGFIVVQIDGMGRRTARRRSTTSRGRISQTPVFRIESSGTRVASKYPWYDTTRVGIYGTSAGGQNSAGALLFHPEF